MSAKPKEKSQKYVLVAEDERPIAKALEIKLKSSGFDAKAVFDGNEALEEIKKRKPDLLLLDLVMPLRDGFSVLEEIKKMKVSFVIVVTSNLSQEEDVKRAKALGVTDYFVKSDTSLAEIVEKIQKYLK